MVQSERPLLPYHLESLGSNERIERATKTIDHPLMVSVFTDNAGGMEFYDGWVVTISETHNYLFHLTLWRCSHEAHGVIRDTIGFAGAYPIGEAPLGYADPDAGGRAFRCLGSRFILKEAIRLPGLL